MDITISDRLESARIKAANGGVPMRRTDLMLYSLLGECLSICEEVERNGLMNELKAAVAVSIDKRDPSVWGKGRSAGNQGKGRKYVNGTSGVHLIVCRYVLEGVDNRQSFYRYATALRAAAKRQIGSAELAGWLELHGGVAQLTKKESVIGHHRRNNFHLRHPVLVPGMEPFTLKLRMTPQGDFVVVD